MFQPTCTDGSAHRQHTLAHSKITHRVAWVLVSDGFRDVRHFEMITVQTETVRSPAFDQGVAFHMKSLPRHGTNIKSPTA